MKKIILGMVAVGVMAMGADRLYWIDKNDTIHNNNVIVRSQTKLIVIESDKIPLYGKRRVWSTTDSYDKIKLKYLLADKNSKWTTVEKYNIASYRSANTTTEDKRLGGKGENKVTFNFDYDAYHKTGDLWEHELRTVRYRVQKQVGNRYETVLEINATIE